MKLSFKTLAATAALGLASSAAFAVVPSVPLPQPVAGPTPTPSSGNSGLIVSVWDTTSGASLVQYLGLTMDQFLPGATNATPTAGLLLNFGTIGAASGADSFATVFGGSTTSNLRWEVSGFDYTTDNITDTYIGKRLMTTLAPGVSTTVRNTAFSTAITAGRTFIESGLNGLANCNGGNPCTSVLATEGDYAGAGGFGLRYGNGLPVNAGSTLDTSLNFYLFSANSNTGGTTPTVVQRYETGAGAAGAAQWLLTSSGVLTYTVPAVVSAVPVPAAIWLFGSALMGLVGVGRRRHAANALAA